MKKEYVIPQIKTKEMTASEMMAASPSNTPIDTEVPASSLDAKQQNCFEYSNQSLWDEE
jgi:hypothetical protein